MCSDQFAIMYFNECLDNILTDVLVKTSLTWRTWDLIAFKWPEKSFHFDLSVLCLIWYSKAKIETVFFLNVLTKINENLTLEVLLNIISAVQ
jgi:hypothetical protein